MLTLLILRSHVLDSRNRNLQASALNIDVVVTGKLNILLKDMHCKIVIIHSKKPKITCHELNIVLLSIGRI